MGGGRKIDCGRKALEEENIAITLELTKKS